MTDTLTKKIGLMSLIFLCLNGIVGSGLFLLPGQVAFMVGNWGLLSYLLVALIIMSIGWCYAQCASKFTRNGGPYLYAKKAFGDFIGFEVGLMRYVVGVLATASLTSGFIVALGALFPVATLSPNREILTVSIIAGLGIINIFGATIVTRLSNTITISKIALLLLFIPLGLLAMQFENLIQIQQYTPPPSLTSFGGAALIIFFAFSGFEGITVVAGETENPKKNLPRAMMIGIFLSSLLYFIVQFICIGALGTDLAASASPLVDVAEFTGGPVAKLLVSVAMIISIGGTIVNSSFFAPRSLASLAEEQMVFASIAHKNRFGVPVISIGITSLLACIVTLSGSFVELLIISVISRFVQHFSTTIAVYKMERMGLMQPFNRHWKRVIPLFAVASLVWLLSFAEYYHIFWGLGALVIGIPLYFAQKMMASTAQLNNERAL